MNLAGCKNHKNNVYLLPNQKTILMHDVITFGCRLNTYESEVIKNNLELSGLENVIVFNTCAVTKEAERQAKQSIRKHKRDNPDAKIIVTGCAAQNNPLLFSSMPEVDKILGNEEKLHHSNYHFGEERVLVEDIMTLKETALHMTSHFEGKARAFLQVQNGCNHRCTFCIIPYGRGNSRSVPIGAIVEEVRSLVAQGFNEVVFTGVDVTAYGPDLPGNPTFAQMLRRTLSLVPELPRLRLSSIDVAEIDDELFNLIATEKRIMPHLHISLQAGDNMILKRMKRRHNREQVIEFCNRMRSARPEVSFGADIIAGFPTETDEMFENTRRLISEAQLQYLHVFPYSPREGTPAARMPQMANKIRKERAGVLRAEGEKELAAFYERNIGRVVQVLVEKDGMGHTESFIPVKLSSDFAAGAIVKAKLFGIEDNYMIGVIDI